MIVDGHAHVADNDRGGVTALLRQLDEAGIDRCLCVPGGMLDVRRFDEVVSGRVRPQRAIPNALVYRALEQHPDRLLGLVCVDPNAGSAALQMLEEGLRSGCRGVKLAPLVHGFRFDAPVLGEVADACGERSYPLYSHVTPMPGATTHDFAALARAHPRTNFILGHMGFGPYDSAALGYAEALANLYLETSLGNYLALNDGLARLGAKKLVFGSEFPLGHPKGEMENVRLLNRASHEAILGKNILRLLNLASGAA